MATQGDSIRVTEPVFLRVATGGCTRHRAGGRLHPGGSGTTRSGYKLPVKTNAELPSLRPPHHVSLKPEPCELNSAEKPASVTALGDERVLVRSSHVFYYSSERRPPLPRI